MLVLTRRIGETIIVDNNIRITIVSVGPGRVKIGIDAPSTVRIDREEIHHKIAGEATTAAPAPVVEEPHLVDDTPKLHNRIADRLPQETLSAGTTTAAGTPKAAADNKARPRVVRKPR